MASFNPSTPLLFTQIGRGALSTELQQKFEKAQTEAMAEGVGAKVTLEIAIVPPETGELTGAIAYTIGVAYGKKRHKPLSTLVNEETGLIYADGAGDPRQLGMFEDVDRDTGEVIPTAQPVSSPFQPRRASNG